MPIRAPRLSTRLLLLPPKPRHVSSAAALRRLRRSCKRGGGGRAVFCRVATDAGAGFSGWSPSPVIDTSSSARMLCR